MYTNPKKFLIDIGHPANVHLFKYFFAEMTQKGWKGLFVVTEKEVTKNLLDAYELPYIIIGKNKSSFFSKISSLPGLIFRFYKFIRLLAPDVIISRGSLHAALTARILKIPHIVLSDTEGAGLLNRVSSLFVDVILTSFSYRAGHGLKQIRYPSYHELAYMHPDHFRPDPGVLSTLGIANKGRFALVRLVSWTAHHDVGQRGLSTDNRLRLINELSKVMNLFISSEGALPSELEKFRLKLDPQYIHSLLAYADLVVSEGATVASESACLGTPTIYVNTIQPGLICDLAKYGLLFTFTGAEADQEMVIQTCIEFAARKGAKRELSVNRAKMLNDKIDLSKFLVWFVDNYPESFMEAREATFNFNQFRLNKPTFLSV